MPSSNIIIPTKQSLITPNFSTYAICDYQQQDFKKLRTEFSDNLKKALKLLLNFPLPEWCKVEEVIEQMTIAFNNVILENDEELKHIIKEIPNIIQEPNSKEAIDKRVEFFHKFASKIKKNSEDARNLSIIYSYNSDFNPSLFSLFMLDNETQVYMLEFLKRRAKEIGSIMAKQSRSDYLLSNFRRLEDRIMKLGLRCKMNSFRLQFFINVWNSESYDDILKPKYLSKSRITESTYEELKDKFETSLRDLRSELLKMDSYSVRVHSKYETDEATEMLWNQLAYR